MLDRTEVALRLKKVMLHFGLSAAELAASIGVPRSSISHILSGRNKPSLEFVLKLIEVHKEIDLHWLLKGRGTFPTPLAQTALDGTKTSTLSSKTAFATKNKESAAQQKQTSEEIEKILIFYKDGTFEVHQSRSSKS